MLQKVLGWAAWLAVCLFTAVCTFGAGLFMQAMYHWVIPAAVLSSSRRLAMLGFTGVGAFTSGMGIVMLFTQSFPSLAERVRQMLPAFALTGGLTAGGVYGILWWHSSLATSLPWVLGCAVVVGMVLQTVLVLLGPRMLAALERAAKSK